MSAIAFSYSKSLTYRIPRRINLAPISWQQELWPTEEFELARSRVPVRLPETDLFAGIEDEL